MTRWPTGFPPSSHPSNLPPSSWITRARHDSRRQYLHNFGFPTSQICQIENARAKLMQLWYHLNIRYPPGRQEKAIFCFNSSFGESSTSAIYTISKRKLSQSALLPVWSKDHNAKITILSLFYYVMWVHVCDNFKEANYQGAYSPQDIPRLIIKSENMSGLNFIYSSVTSIGPTW